MIIQCLERGAKVATIIALPVWEPKLRESNVTRVKCYGVESKIYSMRDKVAGTGYKVVATGVQSCQRKKS